MAALVNYDDDSDINNNELVTVDSFYSIGEKAKCNIGDCKTELKTKTTSHLIRHIYLMHPTQLKKIDSIPISQLPIAYLRESSLILAVRHVTIHGRPFSSLNDDSFKTLMSERLSRVNRGTERKEKLFITIPVVRKKVNEIAELCKREMMDELKDKPLCFMMDIVSRYYCSLIGVSVQFIDNGVLKVRTIMMEKILKRHTMKNLSEMFVEMLNRYNIPMANVFSLTTDNGSNILATAADLEELATEENNDWTDIEVSISMAERNDRQEMLAEIARDLYGRHKLRPIDFQQVSSVRCGSHTFHLAVKAGLNASKFSTEMNDQEPLSNLINKAREVIKELRNPVFLIELEKKNIRKPVKDNVTRWFSTHVMVSSSFA